MEVPLAALRAACCPVAVSARPGSGAEIHARTLGAPCLVDAAEDPQGPLAGIRRGLAWARDEELAWLAVAPCDAPTLDGDHYRALIRAIQDGAPAAVGRGEAGLEPLVSIWPVSAGYEALQAAFAKRTHPPIRVVLETIGAVPVGLTGYDGRNVNTPLDMPIPS